MTDLTNSDLQFAINRLMEYRNYFSLLKSNPSTYEKIYACIGEMPNQLKAWFGLFNGGLLFTTSMFSTEQKTADYTRLLTFAEINSAAFKAENNIPTDIVCFAMTNYGNYYCYVKNENCEHIYEWDAEKCSLVIKWTSFAEWLNEQLDFADSLIQDDLLDLIGE